ncbi:hypothetical protein O181_024493 [Austropuccinia psidii MF-1]|uniref:Uncharacterized protein n=1 Tax=Austropuccinia psidii MF-1 TaxID=1389203 RepID=A0A9Q3GY95_9BASI|nr:hypothetical protein [Austropuccinia psidii MF-1]
MNKFLNVCQNIEPRSQRNVLVNTPYHQDIKLDDLFGNKQRSSSQDQDGENMTSSENEELKELPEASSCSKFSVLGEYDHIELIDYIGGLFIDVPIIKYYWITARLNTAFKGHASIWYTEIKSIHGRRNWPWLKSQITKTTLMVLVYFKGPYHL